ncbi:queuosine precursor transporter [Corynebacterium yudongzhengii]|nr:queuosine precursor transporter [Corynebacterium yudongzhengii]
MTAEAPRHVRTGTTIFPVLVAVSAAVFLISNITATKGVQIGPFVLDAAFFLFPLGYVVGDVISEVYGFRNARLAIFTSFGITILAAVCFYIAIWLPEADFYDNQEAFASVLGLVPQIILASLAGYAVGQLLNAWALVQIKKRTGEKSLWARLLGSTVIGQFGDTLLFCAIAAPVIGVATAGDFINYVLVGFAWKTALEALLLPITYAVVGAVKRHENY